MGDKPKLDDDVISDLRKAFVAKTDAYWAWLARYCVVDKGGRKRKVEKMVTPLGFLRGSFYFWPEILSAAGPGILQSPKILGVGDMHIENFGSWRDAEGRLIWGVNDFDDAARSACRRKPNSVRGNRPRP